MSHKAKLIYGAVLASLILTVLLVSIVTLQKDRRELTEHIKDLQTINMQNANINTALNSSNSSLQDELIGYKDALQKANGKIESLEDSLKDTAKANKKLSEQVKSLQKSNDSLLLKVEELGKDLARKTSMKPISYVSKPTTKPITVRDVPKPVVKKETAPPSRGVTPTGIEIYMSATAYTAYCNGCSGITRTGIDLRANPNLKVIAVDPSVIPLGSKVYVEGYGYAVAGDTGGAIKGHKIDIFISSKQQALKWGRKKVKVTILK